MNYSEVLTTLDKLSIVIYNISLKTNIKNRRISTQLYYIQLTTLAINSITALKFMKKLIELLLLNQVIGF